jgi:hypothetical protein
MKQLGVRTWYRAVTGMAVALLATAGPITAGGDPPPLVKGFSWGEEQ